MALRVRLVSAQLTHDTELLTNMVDPPLFRTLIACLGLEPRIIARGLGNPQEKNRFGTKLFNSTLLRIT